MKTLASLLSTLALTLAACGGAQSGGSGGGGSGGSSVVIVDDIDCAKLVNHMVDVHTAANPDVAREKPNEIAQLRRESIADCEKTFTNSPASEKDKASARCAMQAQTTGELEECD